jgi:hypothetical protein
MDLRNLKLNFLLLLSLLISFIKSEICPTFICGVLPDKLCLQRTNNLTVTPANYTLQSCGNKNEQCPFYNLDAKSTLTCEAKNPGLIKLYPGGACSDNNDCMLNRCEHGVCAGTQNGEPCKDSKECNYGLACYKYANTTETRCQPQKLEKQPCESDLECQNTHGCYNKTCTRYFSLPNGHPVEISPPIYLSFCQSGFEYNNQCASLSLKNKQSECDENTPCTYTNYDGKEVILPGNCLCGYNPQGKKYCKLGSGSKEHTDFITSIENLLKDTTKCNTVERKFTEAFCNYYRRFPSKEFTVSNQKLINAKVMSEEYHSLINADKCVIDVAFPEYVPDVPPQPTPNITVTTCAKYECKNRQNSCAYSHSEQVVANPNLYNINVTLSDICKKNEFCDIGGSPNVVFYQGVDVNATCKARQAPSGSVRFPGEVCDNNNPCYKPDSTKYPNETLVGTCENGYCNGYKEGESCFETAWCNVGYYCDSKTMKCKSQKRENDECALTTECRNYLLCWQGKCQNVWYSLPENTLITGQGDYNPAYYCKSGMATNGKCDYMNTVDPVNNKTNLVDCFPGQKCNYTTINGQITRDCECGYNTEGKSYCPKGHNLGKFYFKNKNFFLKKVILK